MQLHERYSFPLEYDSFIPEFQTFIEQTLGEPMIAPPQKMTSGEIHTTFAIQTQSLKSYLKIRGETRTEPHDPRAIENEWRALLLFGKYIPGVFPNVLGFDQKHNALLVSEIEGTLALDIFNLGNVSNQICLSIGQTIGSTHRLLATIPQNQQKIHQSPEKAQHMAQYILAQRIFRIDNPAINSLGISLLYAPNKQLVLGDQQTKNMIIRSDGSAGIFDLEFAHKGHVLHDVSHLLGEVILRSAHETNPSRAAQIILTGYLQENPVVQKNDPFLLKLVLASMLFQIAVAHITNIKRDKTSLLPIIHSLLNENSTKQRNNLSWDILDDCLANAPL